MILDMAIPFLNFLAPEVTIVLSGGCFHFGYNFNNFNVDDYVYTLQILHIIWQALTSSALVMAPEDVYNMDDTHAQPKK